VSSFTNHSPSKIFYNLTSSYSSLENIDYSNASSKMLLLFHPEDWLENHRILEHGIQFQLRKKHSFTNLTYLNQIGTPFYIYGITSLNHKIIYIISYITPIDTASGGIGPNYLTTAWQNIGNKKDSISTM